MISTFNLPNGINQSVNLSRAYFEFKSSNAAVATVNANGNVSSLSAGSANITATLGGVQATGSLTINCAESFCKNSNTNNATIKCDFYFLDAYTNVPVNYYNGYWAPFQTTLSSDFSVANNNVLHYTNFNFVGIEFSAPTVNASTMTNIHLDVFFPNTVTAGRQLRVIVISFRQNGVFGGDSTRHTTTFTTPFLESQNWKSIDIPFSAMPGLASRSNLAQITLEGGDGTSLYVDNVYFWR